jgi:hypothetical protein
MAITDESRQQEIMIFNGDTSGKYLIFNLRLFYFKSYIHDDTLEPQKCNESRIGSNSDPLYF